MRYAEAQYGEQAIAIGVFDPGDVVTIKLLNLATDALLALDYALCTESTQIPGFFTWDAANVTPPYPTGVHQYLYVMTNAAGRTHAGKLVIGGYPSDSAKRRFQQAVWIDVANGSAGTAFDLGTPENPVDNVLDARVIADRERLTAYQIRGAITLTATHENWSFYGAEPVDDIITVQAGVSVAGSQFETISIRGDLTGSITAKECLIGVSGGTVTGLSGTFTTCGFDGVIQPAPMYIDSGRVQGLQLASQSTNILSPGCVLDFNNQLCHVLAELVGIWTVRNINDDFAVLAVSLTGCILTLEPTVAGGQIILIGYGEVVDQKTGAASFTDNVVRGTRLNKVWDGTVGTRVVDQTADPAQWKLRVKKGDDDLVDSHSFDLVDGEGDPISDTNPLTQFIGRQTRI